MGLLTLLQNRLELHRLESRYVLRRPKRRHFISSAIYVDGEYVYPPSPSSPSPSPSPVRAGFDRPLSDTLAAPTKFEHHAPLPGQGQGKGKRAAAGGGAVWVRVRELVSGDR